VTLKAGWVGWAVLLAAGCAWAQDALAPVPPPSGGTVLFQSHGQSPEPDSDRKPLVADATKDAASDRERAAVTVTAYDLDVHVQPATGRFDVRARLTVRNDGAEPLARVPLAVSSELRWEGVAVADPHRALAFTQVAVETDADHTGSVNEAEIAPLTPLAPGATLKLDVLYGGVQAPSSERLRRIGATAAQAEAAEWDGVADGRVALRGFGNAVWYPVAAAPVFLGDGAKLFEAVGKMKRREQAAAVSSRATPASLATSSLPYGVEVSASREPRPRQDW